MDQDGDVSEHSDDSTQDPTYFKGMEKLSEKEIKERAKVKKMTEIFGKVEPKNDMQAKVLARIDEIIDDEERFKTVMATNGYDDFIDKLFATGKLTFLAIEIEFFKFFPCFLLKIFISASSYRYETLMKSQKPWKRK